MLRAVLPSLCAVAAFLVLSLAMTSAADKPDAPKKREPVKLTDEALALHKEALVFDGHNDLPWQFREKAGLSFTRLDVTRDQKAQGLHTDIPRLRKGGVGAQFWAAYVPVETRKKGTAVRDTLEQIDVIRRMVRAHPDTFELAARYMKPDARGT